MFPVFLFRYLLLERTGMVIKVNYPLSKANGLPASRTS